MSHTENYSSDSIAKKLRSIRNARKLSLADVEKMSGGTLRAVVLGSYERGAREMSIKRAAQIADIYQISLQELVAEKENIRDGSPQRILLNLAEISSALHKNDHSAAYSTISNFAQSIVHKRQDWNGTLLSIRQSDAAAIGDCLGWNEAHVVQWLSDEKLTISVSHSH